MASAKPNTTHPAPAADAAAPAVPSRTTSVITLLQRDGGATCLDGDNSSRRSDNWLLPAKITERGKGYPAIEPAFRSSRRMRAC